ncbi:MAG: glycosyltransferase [Candidatus Viridilinea halotolerans]|uniref:Glycosyltransferase n=1 Tax=Candidatus Viridilinea halotolerans TaxID=2491704 RepID=A0A426UAV6_9CHLR|nr:MAG: glycosyltransferase [Candidatus Viridilinea halotolerans]
MGTIAEELIEPGADYRVLIDILAAHFGERLKLTVLFGSRSRSEARSDSDHDVTSLRWPLSSAPIVQKVLVVAYHYPPADHAGTRRVTSFARYLPDLGYRPVILTTNARGSQVTDNEHLIFRASELSGLLARPYRAWQLRNLPKQQQANAAAIAADSRVSRRLNDWLIPDIHITWLPLALRKGLQLLREQPIKLIFSSSPPATSHLVALRLKQLTGLPWVADFRDGWMFEPPNPAPLKHLLRTKVESALEQRVVLGADRIVTVNQVIADDFARRYPEIAHKIVIITNGYDPSDFVALKRKVKATKLRFVHTGALSLSRAATSIAGLLTALKQLQVSMPALTNNLELLLVGQLTEIERTIIANAHLGERIRLIGSVSHQEALQWQADADALVLVTVPGTTSVTTSKLFEYLASGRPILALTGRSSAAEIIRELDAGIVVAPDDAAGIQQAIVQLHARWLADDLPTKRDPRVERYSRPRLTAELAHCFDALLAQ